MRSKKQILVILSLIIVVIISAASKADTHWNLLEGIDPNPTEFKELVIGNKIVYWHQRIMDEAIVELDYIVYQFDKKTQELKDVKGHWREDLPPFFPELNVTKEQAESMVKGEVQFSQLFIISPESDIFSPIKPTPKNPCWVVVSVREVKGMLITVIDAVEGKVLGYGISPPSYTAFSLKGPQEENPCWGSGYWDLYYKNEPNGALYWFDEMGYTPEANEWPTEEKVKSHIQSDTTAMFYEIAHSRYTCGILFASGCVDGQCYELTTAEEIDDWISDYTKLPFTFIASCFGMCCTDVGTLSHAFRMGSTRDTATVGYCEMSTEKCLIDEEESCWSFARKWQRRLFECMNDGNTVKEAFDLANADSNDYHLKSEAGRWNPYSQSWIRDGVTSPCIDGGEPNSDWTAELWPHGKRINMGAYGGTPQASMSLSNAGIIADLNTDDFVDYTDMMQLTDKWLYEAVLLSEDLSRDGIVNFTDFAIFARNWGLPGQASNPHPYDRATDIDINADLSWTAGVDATSHDVYFGTTNPPPFIGNQTAKTFDPGTMTISTTYYWRIDEVGPYGSKTTGTVWSFTTDLGPPPL